MAAAPKIREVHVRSVRVPMEHPHQTASGVLSESPLVLTDVVTDEGVKGHSIVFTYNAAAIGPTADLIRNFAPLLKDESLAPTEIEQKLTKRFRLLGTEGLVGMALAGIDMALWDALARTQKTSLVRLLGAVERPIPAYGAVGYDGVSGSARVAEGWAKRGFQGVKAKLGYPTVKKDVEVIRAIRKAVGDELAVMVDYNQSLTPAEAVQRLRALDDEGLTWVEEPTLAHDHRGHAWVAKESRTPIQCGENWWGPHELQRAIDAHASDYVMPDAMKIGGVSGWLRAAALAEAHGIPVSSHLWPELSAQLLCATPTRHYLEYADWWNPILAEPLQIDRGMATVEGAAGTGVTFNEAAVARFMV
jgi:mandelate racemase